MSNAAVTERLLRGAEVAEVIGCSRAMAYRLMQRGTIPVVRIPGGKTVRVPRDALLQWIRDNTRDGRSGMIGEEDGATSDWRAAAEARGREAFEKAADA